MEKASQSIAEEMTQFWMSMVQNKQLQQLGMQLSEAEVLLRELTGSLNMIPPIM